jgi:site-specific DNA recombinase
MYVPSNTPKYVCYRCRNKIPVVDLEGIFHEQLKSFVFSPDEVAGYLRQADETIKRKEELLEALRSQEQALRREMDKLYDLYLANQIDKSGFGERYHPLADRLKQLEQEQPKLQAEVDVMKVQYLSSDQVLSDARDLYTRWPSISFEDKRNIVEAITDRITVGKEEVEIHLAALGAPPLSSINQCSEDVSGKATKPHGFIAATSWNRAG